MSDQETKEKRSKARKRNFYAKSLYDDDEFQQKIINPKKGIYRRERINVRNYDQIED